MQNNTLDLARSLIRSHIRSGKITQGNKKMGRWIRGKGGGGSAKG